MTLAAYTPIILANLALARLGDKRISSFDEKGEAARACKEFYPHAVRSAFEAHEWTCFKRTAQLVQIVTTAPLLRWKYAYAFPPNCIRLGALGEWVDMEPQYQDWDQTADYIAANAGTLYAEYVAGDFSEAQYPAYFAAVVEHQLAIFVSTRIQGTLASREALEKSFNEKTLPNSRSKDSMNQPTRTVTRSFYSEARFGRRVR